MKKRIFATLLIVILTAGILPAANAAVDSGDAQAYLKAIDNKPSASSYLVDFDRDGTDELVLTWNDFEQTYYEVWSGSQRLVSKETRVSFNGVNTTPSMPADIFLTERDGRPYLYEFYILLGDSILNVYTVENGAWTLQDELVGQFLLNPGANDPDDGQWVCTHNGASVSYEAYTELVSDFQIDSERICGVYIDLPAHSVRNQVLAALDTSVDGYRDVLSTLSESEKTALFEGFLQPFAGSKVDFRTVSDQQLLQMINDAWYDHNFAFAALESVTWKSLPNGDSAMTKSDADRLISELFGRTIDFSQFERTILPDPEDMNNFCYVYQNMLCFHAYFGMGGYPGEIRFIPRHLYDLGNGYFVTCMEVQWWLDSVELETSYLCYSVIKKNEDGTYRWIRDYGSTAPTDAELAALIAPSSWAQAEISAAEAAGLIPELNGNPGWQDNTTRLQFAQLAVRLAEQATGQTLPVVSASTFVDCSNLDVRKAYAAGIVSGTSDTTFSPGNSLTREQLAAMLWRTAGYIQKQTGKQELSAGGSLAGYTDAGRVSAYAKEAVASLAQHGIMKGTSATELSPQENCSVEQSILLTYRMMQKLV